MSEPTQKREVMMAREKNTVAFEIQADAEAMLEFAASKYGLPDKHKALRCLLDYLAQDGDWDQIFTLVRCTRCSKDGGWEAPAA